MIARPRILEGRLLLLRQSIIENGIEIEGKDWAWFLDPSIEINPHK
jgi:hypothetical protein